MTMTLIESYTFPGAVGSKTFSAIPGTYKALQVIATVRSARVDPLGDLSTRVNGDTGANYNYEQLIADGTAAVASYVAGDSKWGAPCPAASAPAGEAVAFNMIIPNYANTTFNKHALYTAGHRRGTTAALHEVYNNAAWWLSTAAITSLTFYEGYLSTFVAGSTIDLYGIN